MFVFKIQVIFQKVVLVLFDRIFRMLEKEENSENMLQVNFIVLYVWEVDVCGIFGVDGGCEVIVIFELYFFIFLIYIVRSFFLGIFLVLVIFAFCFIYYIVVFLQFLVQRFFEYRCV